MTPLLSHLLGRLPIGWLQLQHNKTRLIAAVGGVTFANILIFMQLGFMGALFESSVKSHRTWNADIVIASSDFRSLREANPLPRARMLQALAADGVTDAAPVYVSPMTWTDPETGDTTSFRVLGVEPEQPAFLDETVQSQLHLLSQSDTALLDRASREINPNVVRAVKAGPHRVEFGGRQVDIVGLFAIGASFSDDGTLIVSAQTFLRLFPQRSPETPTLVFVRCDRGSDVQQVAHDINVAFPEEDARAWTKDDFILAEQAYQRSQTPIGFVFSFGVVIGLIVGLVIVYQVLILMGPSGSGKTTLLTLVGCLRNIQSGSVDLLGQALHGADDTTLRQMRRRLGFIFQAHNLHASLSALQNVRMGLEVHGGGAMKHWTSACKRVLKLVGLTDRMQHLPAKLSGGEKQRVAIARALVGNPDIIFADEPTAALDGQTGHRVIHILRRLADERGTTSVIVSHDHRIHDLADRIVEMEDGRVVDYGSLKT